MRSAFGPALISVCVSLLLPGCGGAVADGTANDNDESTGTGAPSVTLLAAASTITAVEEIGARFTEQTGIAVKISPGPSNGLAQQILAGAPADVYLSANPVWAEVLEEKDAIAKRRPLLSNRLVLVVPEGNPAEVTSLDDLRSDRVRTVAIAGENVPAGMYAEQALRSLNLYEALDKPGKLARGRDVRVTLSYVERGEADAGLVYASDAAVSSRVEVAHTFAPERYERIVYPAVLVERSRQRTEARRFYTFLCSSQAGEIFRQRGFVPLVSSSTDG